MNELNLEISRTNIALYDLGRDLDSYNLQHAHGMAAVVTGEIKRLRAYLQGLRKAKELINE